MNVGSFKRIDVDASIEDSFRSVLPFQMNNFPDYIRQRAETELGETDESKKTCLETLRKLIAGEETTQDIVFEEDYLVQFLRLRKYDVERAFRHLKNSVKLFGDNQWLLEPIAEQYICLNNVHELITVMPKRCEDGCPILIVHEAKWNPDELPYDCFVKLFSMIFLQLSRCAVSQVTGVKVIVDCRGLSAKQLLYLTPTNIKKSFQLTNDGLIVRWKKIHLINNSEVMRLIWAVLSKVTEKIKKRFVVHSSPDELLSHFPAHLLPVEYGGQVSDLSSSREWIRRVNKEHGGMSAGGMSNFF